jgi:4-diphosphocytidyl-2-C-methyl-D-erythritol kinase
MAETVALEAPCKVNLFLAVGGKRADGFHDIESIFAAFSLRDTLEFEAGGRYDEVVIDTAELPPAFNGAFGHLRRSPEKNLVCRAIKLFKRETGFGRAVKASVQKRIPPGGGLGGGSSDAAAALVAMNALGGGRLSVPALAALGDAIGSDVPFFVRVIAGSYGANGGEDPCSAAFVSGRGERVEAAGCPPLDAVIVNPGFESNTAKAFAMLDAARAAAPAGGEKRLSKQYLLDALTKNPAEWPFYNDFLPVFLKTPPFSGHYAAILRELARNGAVFSGLSGSGASCFGIFDCPDTAKAAAARLSQRWPFVRYAHCG